MYAFDYVKPGSVDEALQALQTEDAQAISGGQTLIPTLKARLARPSQLVDLTGIPELRGLEATAEAVTLRGGATHGTVARDPEVNRVFPALASLAARIGDPAVRNRGTVGGSIANNDPSACYPAAALGTGATVVAQGSNGRREIAADDYFQGMFMTALEEGEIVAAVRFPVPERARYEKFIQPASRFALVAAFVAKFGDGVRVAITGASENGVFRWSEAEQALGAGFSADALDALQPPAADEMIADIHGSKEYRAHLCKVMTRRAVAAAA
jgi:carbon-monoxide dehydrogenase medium subunit